MATRLSESQEVGTLTSTDDESKDSAVDGRLTRSVMSAFFKDGKLVSIPAKHSKRMVVLEKLLAEFKDKDSYHEREINDILKNFHDDVATIRREFIMNRYMTREDGYYRLTDKGLRALA
jgi:hypothetical protein